MSQLFGWWICGDLVEESIEETMNETFIYSLIGPFIQNILKHLNAK